MAKKPTPFKSYKILRAELDEILMWFETENIDLDEAVVKYQQARQLVAEIEKYLDHTENKVKSIKAKFEL